MKQDYENWLIEQDATLQTMFESVNKWESDKILTLDNDDEFFDKEKTLTFTDGEDKITWSGNIYVLQKKFLRYLQLRVCNKIAEEKAIDERWRGFLEDE